MKKNIKKTIRNYTLVFIAFVVAIALCNINFKKNIIEFNNYKEFSSSKKLSETQANLTNYNTDANLSTHIYLSDLKYINIPGYSSFAENNKIGVDKNFNQGAIKLKVNGEITSYGRGVNVWAKGQVIYDISEYSNTYTHFVSTVGIDPAQKKGKFWVQFLVSNDGKSWQSLYKTANILAGSNAINIDIDITGYKYLRIYIDPVDLFGGRIPDREGDYCVLAGAKLITTEYDPSDEVYSGINKLDYYDAILSVQDAEYNYQNNYRTVLERELINKLRI